MNRDLVSRIKALCKQRGTSCTKIELEYGWGNGAIGKWVKLKSLPPLDRLQIVADHLGTTVNYLLTGENENKPAIDGELDELQREAFNILMSMTKEEMSVFVTTWKTAKGE